MTIIKAASQHRQSHFMAIDSAKSAFWQSNGWLFTFTELPFYGYEKSLDEIMMLLRNNLNVFH